MSDAKSHPHKSHAVHHKERIVGQIRYLDRMLGPAETPLEVENKLCTTTEHDLLIQTRLILFHRSITVAFPFLLSLRGKYLLSNEGELLIPRTFLQSLFILTYIF